ncbi:MAG: hypothetical protein AAF591_22355 [Verrucomicrobiota bacterium]
MVYEATTAKTYGELLPPHRTVLQRQGKEGTRFPISADTANPVGRAVLINKVGKGQVLTFACSPGEAATSEFHITEARQLLPNAVRLLSPEPSFTVDAPAFVESVVTREGTTVRFHFIARIEPSAATPVTGRPAVLPTMMEDTPLFRIRIDCQRTPKSVSSFSAKTQLTTEKLEITAVIEDVHEVLLLEFE